MGGAVAAPEEVPAEGGAPMEEGAPQGGELEALAGQILDALLQQLQDPNLVMQVLQLCMDMLSQAASQAQPTFKKGGKLAKRCGGKMKK